MGSDDARGRMRWSRIKNAQVVFAVLSLFFLFSDGVCKAQPDRIYPLPIAELQRVLSRWLVDSGCTAHVTGLPDGAVRLSASRNGERWLIVAQPQSPLYSTFDAQCLAEGRPDTRKVEALRAFMDDYVAKYAPVQEKRGGEIPAHLFRVDSVVCLSAVSGNSSIQFSGFVADQSGLILSTAHDLDQVTDIGVMTSDGRKRPGRVIRKDRKQDLVLIRTAERFSSALSVSDGRIRLKKGERIYVLTCAEGERKILTGLVSGPVTLQGNLLLWQVEMDTPRGSSGSPVFDRDGKLLGIIKGRYRGNSSIGFLIPLETVAAFLHEE